MYGKWENGANIGVYAAVVTHTNVSKINEFTLVDSGVAKLHRILHSVKQVL